MLEEIISIIAEITEEDVTEFSDADRIPDILPDSVSRMDLISRIKQKYNVVIKNRQVYTDFVTISALADYVQSKQST